MASGYAASIVWGCVGVLRLQQLMPQSRGLQQQTCISAWFSRLEVHDQGAIRVGV